MLGNILLAYIPMHIFDMLDRSADCIYERRAASDEILLLRHGLDLFNGYAVVEHFAHVIKEDGGNERLALLFFLLIEHGVEASDSVALKPSHGTAAVKNEYNLR